MIEIPDHPNYHDNAEKCEGDEQPCVVCGKPVTGDNVAYVHVVGGGGYLALPDDEFDEAGDCGAYPIGAGCLKKHPELKPYAQK